MSSTVTCCARPCFTAFFKRFLRDPVETHRRVPRQTVVPVFDELNREMVLRRHLRTPVSQRACQAEMLDRGRVELARQTVKVAGQLVHLAPNSLEAACRRLTAVPDDRD